MKKSMGRNLFLFACVAPATILFFIFMIVPTINVFRMSLFQRGAYSPEETFVGLNNFKTLINDASFIKSMQNMILLVVVVTIITFAFAIIFAAILTREEIKGQNFFRIVFYIPNILSVVVISGIFGSIVAPSMIKLFRIKDPMVAGVSIGTCAHGGGTSRAVQLGETQGAMSGLAIGVAGICTVVISLFL